MGSVVLVTENSYDLNGVQCADSLKNVDWADLDCLVFHSSKDTDFEAVRILSEIKSYVSKVIYINADINPLFYCIFTGLDADIYDSEDFLADEGVLKYLIEDYKETGMTMKSSTSEIETITKYISALSDTDLENVQSLLGNSFWLKTLNTAVSNVNTAVVRADQANFEIVTMLDETVKLIKTLESSQLNTTNEIEKLKVMVKDLERKERPNIPFLYSRYTVPLSVQKVMYIRSVGPCRYLNSFILAYQDYLKMAKQYSTKVLFILPNLSMYIRRYENAPRISMDSVDILRTAEHDYFITFEPKKTVLDHFFNQQRIGIFIVVDLTLGDPLIEGSMVEKYFAASSANDVQRFDLRMDRTFVPQVGPDKGPIIIPHLTKYATSNTSTRKSMYYTHLKDRFERLNSVLIKDGR
jgi:hypothetical protein